VVVFWGSFFPGLEGFVEIKEPDVEIFRPYMPDIAAFIESNYKPGESVICVGKIRHVGSTYVDQFKFLASLVTPGEVKNIKLTLAAPNWYHLRYKEGRAYPGDVYASDDEYFADIAKAYQAELRILYYAGCRNVQFDDPNFACRLPERFLL
jgi:methionine synthase II (cobalamin-independent)